MMEQDGKILAERITRKLTLQARSISNEKRRKLNEKWKKNSIEELCFLDLESSLAIYSKLNQKQIKYENEVFAAKSVEVEAAVNRFVSFLSSLGNKYGFCFTNDWMTIGAFIVNVRSIRDYLPDLMYIVDDELKFYSYDFVDRFELSGDRAGSGDKLSSVEIRFT